MRSKRWRRTLAVLCTLALVLVPLVHRPTAAGAQANDGRIAYYLALGGALADLCLNSEADDRGAGQTDCPACTLAKTLALAPAPMGSTVRAVWRAEHTVWPEFALPLGQGARAPPPARGPPSKRMI